MREEPQLQFVQTAATVLLAAATLAPAAGDPWLDVPVLRHADYQSVTGTGASAYAGGFPVRLVGVVLNHSEDWLNPTPAYTAAYQPFALGGQAELYVQAVNLDGTEWDPAPEEPFDDFGGTACWIGQNYGNLPFVLDPAFNYTDPQFTAELARLGLAGGDGVTNPLRAGDLVEVRARGGLHRSGKMNVNEQHDLDPDRDFELVVLRRGHGLPGPAPLTLTDLKDSANQFLFDPSRQTGGERHQSTRVRLHDVWLTSAANWSANANLTVTDGVRTLNLRLGRNPGFDGGQWFAAGRRLEVTGILDQAASNPNLSTDGYQLLVLQPADVAAAAPALAAAVEAGEVVVRWPDDGSPWTLHQSDNLQPTGWQPAPGSPTLTGGQFTWRAPLAPGKRFFRLQQP